MTAIMPMAILALFLKSPKWGTLGMVGYGALWSVALLL